jgi:hypothetical protein
MASTHYWWPTFDALISDEKVVRVSVTEGMSDDGPSHISFHAPSKEAARVIADGFAQINAGLAALMQAKTKDAA